MKEDNEILSQQRNQIHPDIVEQIDKIISKYKNSIRANKTKVKFRRSK